MSDTPKLDPQTQALAHAQPRPVVRFKRKLLIGIAAALCAAVFAATWLALHAPNLTRHPASDEEPNVNRKPGPEQLAALPSNYGQVKLGPPLPGDLGVGILERKKSLGITSGGPDDPASQAEAMRLAQQARQANEAGVFFQVSEKGPTAAAPATGKGGGPPETPLQNAISGGLTLDPSRDPNTQGRKLDFLNQKSDSDIYDPHALQQPVSPYEILAGSVISASLITGLNSDLPGLVVAQVTEPVYDSVSGGILLLPAGSRIIGSYDSVIAFGQSRALVVWQRIVMPNGTSIQIDNLPASDAAGYSGLEDQVDYHTWTLLKGIAMSTLLGVGTQVTFGNNNSDLVEAIRQSTQESANQAGQRIVEKDLNIQPTITVRPGWPLNIIVHKDLVLTPYLGKQP